MDLKDLGITIGKFAPLLGGVVASANPLVGVLVSLIANAFGEDKNSSVTDIINKILNDKDAPIKLKQIELEHQSILYQNEVNDRISARNREEEIVKITGKRDFILECIAFLIIFGFFLMCSLIIFNKIEDKNSQVLYMMFGQLTGGFIMVLSYYFGSTKSQQDK